MQMDGLLSGECYEVVLTTSGAVYGHRKDAHKRITHSRARIWGLGIYMVKKTMDDISYEYRDGKNILRIKNNI